MRSMLPVQAMARSSAKAKVLRPDPAELVKEGIKGKYKEKGRKRATLFHPSFDVDPDTGLLSKEGGDLDVFERTFNEASEPGREAHFFDDGVYPAVVNGVERFRRIEKKEKSLVRRFNPFEEKSVDV